MKLLEDATKPLAFEVTPDCVTKGRKKDKRECVIAQSLKKIPGIRAAEVGARSVRIYMGKKVRRYMTPDKLRVALNTFDETGEWMLPVGEYYLPPPTPGRTLAAASEYEARWRQKRRDGFYAGRRKKAKNQYTHARINPRVLEFAKIRSGE